ncbi:hypothetical protein AcW1_001658 [Taiwanofungus camphoratus]|nr:hypothetical protein AcV5_000299 [Antrodia cinnamomea]KAI0944811.1 hypothetical protein AcV7_001515 [Antrodia cinnamomea]KAI0945431.1 hypothetical protein AcW1_001658 [Antrodia cinnamomea]
MGSFYTSSTVAVHLVIDAMLSEIGKITRRTGLLHEQQTANVDVEDHTARREGIENNDIKSPYRSSHLRIVTIINNSSSIAVSKTHISYGSPESPMYVSACGRPWMSMPSTWEFRRRSFMNTIDSYVRCEPSSGMGRNDVVVIRARPLRAVGKSMLVNDIPIISFGQRYTLETGEI